MSFLAPRNLPTAWLLVQKKMAKDENVTAFISVKLIAFFNPFSCWQFVTLKRILFIYHFSLAKCITVPIILLDAAKLEIGLIFSVYNWDQSKLVCKGAYQRVIRYHHEIRPQPQSSLIRGHFPQKPGFTKMALAQTWPMNNLISFWQIVPRLWVLMMTPYNWRKMQQPQNGRGWSPKIVFFINKNGDFSALLAAVLRLLNFTPNVCGLSEDP